MATAADLLTLVDGAITATLNRKGVQSISVRGRFLSSYDLDELYDLRSKLQHEVESARTGLPWGHGVAKIQGGGGSS